MDVSQQRGLAAKSAKFALGHVRTSVHSQQVGKTDPSPLLGTCETTSGVICPVLVLLVEERH